MINTEDTLYPKDKPLSLSTIRINDSYYEKLSYKHQRKFLTYLRKMKLRVTDKIEISLESYV